MRVALYARVSSDLQEKEETIQSQLAEIRARIETDSIKVWEEFRDEGYSRDNLVRPELDRLRDLMAHGELDRIYILCPDRLASGAKLMLLVEEFQKNEVEVTFLKGATDDTPEGKLLLGMQGLFAEYERTKIMERTRRGRLHKAKSGILVGGPQPYGYLYTKRDGDRPPALSIEKEQAAIVLMIYHWLVEEQLSIRRIAMQLTESGIRSPGGGSVWHSSTAGRILSYELYAGKGYYNKRMKTIPERYKETKQYRKDPRSSFRARDRDEWLPFSAPAIVSRDLWEQAQLQLRQNALHSPRNNVRFQYLLKGLVRCAACGRSLTGQSQNSRGYYRHNRGETSWLQGPCPHNKGYRTDMLESWVWDAITNALQDPDLLTQEYQRRLSETTKHDSLETEQKQIELALKRLKNQEDRVIDAYKNEAIELPRLKEEAGKIRTRRQALERRQQDLERLRQEQVESRDAFSRLEAFCQRVSQGLGSLTFEDKQKLLRLLVNRIVIDDRHVRIEGIIPVGRHGPEHVLCPTRPVH